MLSKIIELSARNKFLVFLLVGFLTMWGIWAVYHTPLDAIPDLSDAQVIVYTEWTGRSPDLVEDQITVDPNRLAAYKLPLAKVMDAVRRSNRDVEGRVVEWSGREYMVRGRGYIHDKSDIEKIAVGTNEKGTPILLRDIGQVQLGPEIRRGPQTWMEKARPWAVSS
jgi:Cu/Ag efflux pump CusA